MSIRTTKSCSARNGVPLDPHELSPCLQPDIVQDVDPVVGQSGGPSPSEPSPFVWGKSNSPDTSFQPRFKPPEKRDKTKKNTNNYVYEQRTSPYRSSDYALTPSRSPAISYGVIAFRISPVTNQPEYLMIRRKNTLGYMDFVRGKMPLAHKRYLMQMFNQMTVSEKDSLCVLAQTPHLCKEKITSLMLGVQSKTGETYNTVSLIQESNEYGAWTEPEWGFPKGKRNSHESDYACALREFNEETGFSVNLFQSITTTEPVEELFIGSNMKTYKHKYIPMFIPYQASLALNMNGFQTSEVSAMRWMDYTECMQVIRGYNVEKKNMLTQLHVELCKNLNTRLFTRYDIQEPMPKTTGRQTPV
jgi:8-oxo-dGTP pyrophosphatase MutT (NUDIX family)